MSNLQSFPGIAGATGTRVDSGNRHNMTCRMHESMMMAWCENQQNANNHLHIYKHKYCIHKDELCLNTGLPLNRCSTMNNPIKAYPPVVSNLGDMSTHSKRLIQWLYHDSRTGEEFIKNKLSILKLYKNGNNNVLTKVFGNLDDADRVRLLSEIANLPYFQAQGYSVGIAWASKLSGDTACTVTIGGLATVPNGAFECRAGQALQWYFDFETDCFYDACIEDINTGIVIEAGMRKSKYISNDSTSEFPRLNQAVIDSVCQDHKKGQSLPEKKRQEYQERSLGMENAWPKGGPGTKKHNIAYPKPYYRLQNGSDHYADRVRIFARCINGARPYEMVDIQLCTQSL